MYDDHGPSGTSELKPCKPNYEEMAVKTSEDLRVFKNFKTSLLAFIDCIGRGSISREPATMASLLGKLELDIIGKERALEKLLKQLESDK